MKKPSTFKVILYSIKAAGGVIGGALVIEQSHPYIALACLAVGAVADQIISLNNWKR
jgi:hypothetical protein